YEILYLWVARMIMMGLHFLNDVPFREVFVHGIVRDIYGKKMSKSLGNVIDPLDIVEKYGTDALRFSLVSSTTAGRDIHLAEESFVSSRNFMNKVYNMTRFILMNISQQDINLIKDWIKNFDESKLSFLGIAEEWIFSELDRLIKKINDYYKKYLLGSIAHELYDFVWFKFCDWYLETAKINLQKEEKKVSTLGVLLVVLNKILKLLHPITPFFTEYIYQNIKSFFYEEDKDSILNVSFVEEFNFKFDSFKVIIYEVIKNIISEIRTIRNEFKIQLNIKPNIIIAVEKNQKILDTIKEYSSYIQRLGLVNNISFINKQNEEFKKPQHSATTVFETTKEFGNLELYVLLEGIIDFEKEKQRLKKEIEETEKFFVSLEQKLNNSEFLTKAPKQEVEKIKEKYILTKEKIEKIKHYYQEL
ncbi:MAG: class I tRNA ligase family protein, partial [Endomicrobiia bacterium]